MGRGEGAKKRDRVLRVDDDENEAEYLGAV